MARSSPGRSRSRISGGGAAPAVDVYIDDGRGGEYPFQTGALGQRPDLEPPHAPDGDPGHQEPALGEVNYAYVHVKNRGTATATDVVVRGYHCKPSAGVMYPNDFDPMTTPQMSAGTVAPNNTETKLVGPFEWTPHDQCLRPRLHADDRVGDRRSEQR